MRAVTSKPPAIEPYVGVDIGGSSIKVGVVTAAGEVQSRRQAVFPLEQGRDASLAVLFDTIQGSVRDAGVAMDRVRAIGIGAPGTMDLEAGVILQPFNLPGWGDLPLRQLTSERFGLPVCLQNDANAAAFGEAWVGAGRGVRSLMFWTLGTGVGGGIVLNGEVLTGAHGHAGECGHTIIQMDGGPQSEFGIHGSVELYAGAKALVRRAHEALRQDVASSLREIAATRELTPLDISQAAEQGDELALRLVRDTGRYLGVGTVNVMHTINPELVLIGGAMTFGRGESPVGRAFLDEVRRTVQAMAFRVPAAKTRIEFASLGNDAGFIGAAGCARRMVESESRMQ
jgi:glucokinase